MRCAITMVALALTLAACGSEQPAPDPGLSSPAGDLTIPSGSPAKKSTEPPASTDDGPSSPASAQGSGGATHLRQGYGGQAPGGTTTKAPVIEVTVGDTRVKGPYPAGTLERLVADQAEPIRWCVGEERDVDADFDEQVRISFEVVPKNAKLQEVKVESRKLSDEVETCIARRFEHTRFPMVASQGVTKVRAEILVRYSLTGSEGGTTK